VMAFVSRYQLLETAILENPDAIVIAERGLDADSIFASMLHDTGKMSREEYTIYLQLFGCFNRLPAKGVIYLRCSPETAKARCVVRNRPGETISLEYLQDCHDRHEAWLLTTALVLDAEHNVCDIERHVQQIETFLAMI